MKRSNRLVILVGVLLAVLAFVAIVILLNQRRRRRHRRASEPTTVTVLVANEAIELGEPVTPDKVDAEQVDPGRRHRDGVSRAPRSSRVSPRSSRFPQGAQVSGEVIGSAARRDHRHLGACSNPARRRSPSRWTGSPASTSSSPPATRSTSSSRQQISVLQETADSAANPDENAPPRFETVTGLENQRTVKAVLQDKRVLYVSDTRAVEPEPTEDTNGDGVVDENDTPTEAVIDSVIIVFAGNDQDAEVIKFAQNALGEQGSLTAVVRHLDDDEDEETTRHHDRPAGRGVRPADPRHRRAAQRGETPAP